MVMSEASPQPFPVHARSVVRALRGSFSDLLLAMGADPLDPASLCREGGLTRTLAWKISKMIQADDPAVVLGHMPGASGVNILLRAAERAGTGPDRLQAARNAVADFERLIDVHCGDRATLEIMGGELSDAGRRQRDEVHRKMLFQGASYVWGAQARVSLKLGIVGPGREPGLLDFASVNAMFDFRRLRPDVTWALASRRSRNDDGTPMETSASEALDPASAAPGSAPLMPAFCSQPLPQLRRIESRISTRFELVEGPVGNTGALTCVFGAVQRNIPYYRSPANEWGEHNASCDIPSETMLFDLFLHESFRFAHEPEALLFSDVDGRSDSCDRRRALPLNETLQDLGVGPSPPAMPDVPEYRKMASYAFDRMGWSPADFRGFRMRIAYPAYPTAVILRYRLPEKPTE
jgi:hypothetical protein